MLTYLCIIRLRVFVAVWGKWGIAESSSSWEGAGSTLRGKWWRKSRIRKTSVAIYSTSFHNLSSRIFKTLSFPRESLEAELEEERKKGQEQDEIKIGRALPGFWKALGCCSGFFFADFDYKTCSYGCVSPFGRTVYFYYICHHEQLSQKHSNLYTASSRNNTALEHCQRNMHHIIRVLGRLLGMLESLGLTFSVTLRYYHCSNSEISGLLQDI